VTDARTFAAEAHTGQTYGEGPYTVHLAEVVAIVRTVDDSKLVESVAWLHDVLEDTATTAVELAEMFGAPVAIAVAMVTDPEGYPNRKTRKAELHRRLADLDPEVSAPARLALLVKVADRVANLRACVASGDSRLKMYQREHAAFRDAAYRPGLCDALWSEMNALLGDAS
jgi:(p)ppGpp synthase/HD superfamily hydrolase